MFSFLLIHIGAHYLLATLFFRNTLKLPVAMVLLTVDLIARSKNHIKTKRNVSIQHYLKRLTHLNFSNRKIDDIVSCYVYSK